MTRGSREEILHLQEYRILTNLEENDSVEQQIEISLEKVASRKRRNII